MYGKKPFGAVLRGLRQRGRLTMEELAEASGVSVRAIGDMERGRSRVPQRRTVVALAEGLGLAEAEREALLAAARSARPTRTVAVAGTVVPPRSVGDFTGREAELALLRKAAERAPAGGAPSVWVLSGPPGCGKTTLALKAAADLAEDFPDGRFVVDLHGVDGPVDTDEALLKLLKALGVSDRRLAQEDPQGRAGLLRALLGDRRCLVVLDNARDEGQVRALLPAGGRSLVLVTSRRPLTGLEDVDRLALCEMAQDEAVDLLRRILGEERADAEAEAVARVAELCGRLPLALRVAGNWLTVRSGWTVDHLVRRLADEERRLGALAAGDVRVEAAFELSYRQLTRQAAHMLRLLSLVPGPDMTAAYGAALTATDVFEAEDVMEELVEAGLLQATFTGRYQLHDLLRLFARSRLAREEEPGEREAADDRLRTWLLETAVVAGRWYQPKYGAPPSSWQGLVPLESTEQARAWLQGEAPSWLAALRAAAGRGEHAQVVETVHAMEWFCNLWAHWGHWPEAFRLAGEAATALGDPYLQAFFLNMSSWSLSCESRYREAVERAHEGVDCARRAQSASQQASGLALAAWAQSELGEVQEAADTSLAAIGLYEETDDREGWLGAMFTHGTSLRLLGRAEEALIQHQRIVTFLDAPDCPVSGHLADMHRANTTSALGRGHAVLRRWHEAADHYRDAVAQAARIGIPHVEGRTLLHLGEALIELGEAEEARSCLRRALALGDAVDGKDLESARKLLGSLPAE
ncbi:helix-turn-helix domain-containing protein [Streptomyces sp. TLI_105]|uniref:helix-turn-helix domain-containing protein n=1 Tax=Streptomyces sp. TLI_105 TaxID=1881019 RepID=UPI00089C00F5|nr:helix-turn-helix domain-containing protein [Streptomyces sp. TLI_105]SEB77385.1 Helix-turn-helix domain-containing protein [Streptomyces sp. TLI_105]